jgi:hypothetical protein
LVRFLIGTSDARGAYLAAALRAMVAPSNVTSLSSQHCAVGQSVVESWCLPVVRWMRFVVAQPPIGSAAKFGGA